jgi:hypothetical protein
VVTRKTLYRLYVVCIMCGTMQHPIDRSID